MSHYFKVLIGLFCIALQACKTTSHVDHIETSNYPLNKPGFTTVDSSILSFYDAYKHIVDSSMNKVLIQSDKVLEKNSPEGLLGNVSADITLEEANKAYKPADGKPVDFCFVNNGGLRAPLPQGDITIGNIFELMPFENEMVIVTLSGETTEKLFSFIANKGGVPIAGLKLVLRDTLVVSAIINGVPFDKSKTYKVVTSDYLANGGDNLSFMSEAINKEIPHVKLRDAFINNLTERNQQGKKLTAKIEGRITYVK